LKVATEVDHQAKHTNPTLQHWVKYINIILSKYYHHLTIAFCKSCS